MIDNNPSISALRQRMLEDMQLRKLAPKTKSTYIRAVKKLNNFLRRSPVQSVGWRQRATQPLPYFEPPALCTRPVTRFADATRARCTARSRAKTLGRHVFDPAPVSPQITPKPWSAVIKRLGLAGS